MFSAIQNYIHDHGPTLLKGTCGIIATVGTSVVSALANVEAWLRIVSLLVGISVGVATFWSIIQKKK
jgi:hypothetical protein